LIALIDGDMAIYMACAAAQVVVDLDDGLGLEPMVDEEEAARASIKLIMDWSRKAGCNQTIVCLSSGVTFRKRILPSYKANRTTPKPLAYQYAVEAVKDEFETWEELHLEADDLMGIAATSEKAQCVVVSRDKDMQTIPGLVFNPDHDRKPVKIRRGMADQMWMRQTMMGDSSDNYTGIPKVGDVKAQEIILSPHRLLKKVTIPTRGKNAGVPKVSWVKGEVCGLWTSMVDYAEKADMTERDLITMAQVARILRTGDFDKERRVVKLWTPYGYEELHLDK
jgi:DNA polymerase-1